IAGPALQNADMQCPKSQSGELRHARVRSLLHEPSHLLTKQSSDVTQGLGVGSSMQNWNSQTPEQSASEEQAPPFVQMPAPGGHAVSWPSDVLLTRTVERAPRS